MAANSENIIDLLQIWLNHNSKRVNDCYPQPVNHAVQPISAVQQQQHQYLPTPEFATCFRRLLLAMRNPANSTIQVVTDNDNGDDDGAGGEIIPWPCCPAALPRRSDDDMRMIVVWSEEVGTESIASVQKLPNHRIVVVGRSVQHASSRQSVLCSRLAGCLSILFSCLHFPSARWAKEWPSECPLPGSSSVGGRNLGSLKAGSGHGGHRLQPWRVYFARPRTFVDCDVWKIIQASYSWRHFPIDS